MSGLGGGCHQNIETICIIRCIKEEAKASPTDLASSSQERLQKIPSKAMAIVAECQTPLKRANEARKRGSMTGSRQRVVDSEDPLQLFPAPSSPGVASGSSDAYSSGSVKRESLSIRPEDEMRIVDALNDAAKKQTTGAIYSIKVDISKTGTLGIGNRNL